MRIARPTLTVNSPWSDDDLPKSLHGKVAHARHRIGSMAPTPKPLQPSQLAPPAATMSVEEYNQWRGSHPQRAKASPYVQQTYPLMLYRGDYDVRQGGHVQVNKVVENAKDHQSALRAGWQDADAYYKKKEQP